MLYYYVYAYYLLSDLHIIRTVTSMHSVPLSGGKAGVYSRMQTVIKVPNVILRKHCSKYLALVVLILQPFLSLHLRHSSFSNPSVALPTSQLILQPFRCFTYVKAHSPILLSLVLSHRLFTYVTWRASHGCITILHSRVKSFLLSFSNIEIHHQNKYHD